MAVDMFASATHYADHLLPIWQALPDEVRGEAFGADWRHPWGRSLPNLYKPPAGTVVLVASDADLQRLASDPARRRRIATIYVEHGAGQTYPHRLNRSRGSAHGYAGVAHPENVVGYVCPSERVARLWENARYTARTAIVGCPRMDPWHAGERGAPSPRTVALTWHWNCDIAPESASALRHYRQHLASIVTLWQLNGWEVLGHGHPRAWRELEAMYRTMRVEAVRDSAEVLDRAGLLIADNTSLLYEFASLGRPVLALNAPWYRRDVEQGLRFWHQVPGWQVDTPRQLAELDLETYVDLDPSSDMRRLVCGSVYAHCDGQAARRAAEFVVAVHQEEQQRGNETIHQPAGRAQGPGRPA